MLYAISAWTVASKRPVSGGARSTPALRRRESPGECAPWCAGRCSSHMGCVYNREVDAKDGDLITKSRERQMFKDAYVCDQCSCGVSCTVRMQLAWAGGVTLACPLRAVCLSVSGGCALIFAFGYKVWKRHTALSCMVEGHSVF